MKLKQNSPIVLSTKYTEFNPEDRYWDTEEGKKRLAQDYPGLQIEMQESR